MSAMQPPGWERIDDYESVWTPFDERFNFRAGTEPTAWPAIDEPAGSIVCSLAPCFDGTGTAEWLRNAINFSVVWGLADLAAENTPLLVLDWQHASYRFWPQRLTPAERVARLVAEVQAWTEIRDYARSHHT